MGREICTKCDFPVKTCICDSLSGEYFTQGKLIILQHPLEAKRTMNTVKILPKCIQNPENCIIIKGRVFSKESHPIFSEISENSSTVPSFILFPDSNSMEVSKISHSENSSPNPLYYLIAIDATWKYAKEMFTRNKDFLLSLGTLIKLPESPIDDDSIELKLRTEPEENCVTTLEAIGRAVGIVEDSTVARDAILTPLRRVVKNQTQFSKDLQERQSTKVFLPNKKLRTQ